MSQFIDRLKKINIFKTLSAIGFVGVFVIVGVLLKSDSKPELASNTMSQEEVGSEIAGVSNVSFEESLGSLEINGNQTFEDGVFVYEDAENAFTLKSTESFEETSDAEFRLPFYWDERFEGVEFATEVETFVVNKSFDEFISGIRYGLQDSFVNENDVVGVQRTTGYENTFVHQAYVDLKNGTTLVFELRNNTSDYPELLSSYIAEVNVL